jgi:hypothetical protein
VSIGKWQDQRNQLELPMYLPKSRPDRSGVGNYRKGLIEGVPGGKFHPVRSALPDWLEGVNKENAKDSKGHLFLSRSRELSGIGMVGMTQKRVASHLKEIKGKKGIDLRQTYSLDNMPFAGAAEQEVRRLLEKRRCVPPEADGAWFTCGDEKQVHEIIDTILQAGFNVWHYAISIGAWPKDIVPTGIDFTKSNNQKGPIYFDKMK